MLLQMKSTAFLLLIFIYGIEQALSDTPCAGRDYGKGSVVCVCNTSYCDTIEPIERQENLVTVIESSRDGLRFQRSHTLLRQGSPAPSDITITFDSSQTYQEIIGFGTAFTDAAGIAATSLGSELTQAIIDSYFSKQGLQYSMARIIIGGTDFSTRKYTYDDDNEADFQLEGFALQPEDFQYKIPLVKAAQNVAEHEIKLFGSAWSAPTWMKTNKDLAGRGRLIGEPGGQYYKTWALYYIKFLEAYRNQSINLWGLTTGNEPINGLIPGFSFNCMAFTPWTQRDFVKKDLGPALNASGFGNIKLLIMDDQRYVLPLWANIVLNDPEAAKYVSGIAFHWYGNAFAPPQLLDVTHRLHPDKFLFASEATVMGSPDFGKWDDGESYAKDILIDLEHWSTGWMDWNYALDESGGPTWVKNFCNAPIIVNATAKEFYKQPTFYAMGHFSKFLPPGSKRVQTTLQDRSLLGSGVLKTGFITPDGTRILILVNTSNKKHRITVRDTERDTYFEREVPEKSIVTFVA